MCNQSFEGTRTKVLAGMRTSECYDPELFLIKSLWFLSMIPFRPELIGWLLGMSPLTKVGKFRLGLSKFLVATY